jgi:hypothetical protein
VSADEGREAVLDGLQKYLDAARADERVPLPLAGTDSLMTFYPRLDGDALAEVLRAMDGNGWTQRTEESQGITWLRVDGRIAGLRVRINAHADDVCEPIEPRPVIERRCPALDVVIAESQEGGAES